MPGITIETESAFAIAIKRLGPRSTATRALLQVLDHFAGPQTPIDESLRKKSGDFIGAPEVRTALRVLADIVGETSPAFLQAGYDLREELIK